MNRSHLDCLTDPYGLEVVKEHYIYKQLLIAVTLFNVVLSISATLGNGLVIVAILRSQNLQTPSYLLITSLAFTDLLLGLVYHPFLVVLSVFYIQKNLKVLCGAYDLVTGFVRLNSYLFAVSILMNALISIDRYLALSLRHKYRIHVTKKRARIAIVSAWVVVLVGFMPYSLIQHEPTRNLFITISSAAVMLTICFFYIKSFLTLHRYTSQVQAAQQPNPLHGNFDVVKYRKTLKTMVAILGCQIFSCIPLGMILQSGLVNPLNRFAVIVMIIGLPVFGLNSSINPVIYLTRFRDIRQECIRTLRKTIICNR